MFKYIKSLHKENPTLLPLFAVNGFRGIQLLAYLASQALKEPSNIPGSEKKDAHPDIILDQESLRSLDELQQTLIQATLDQNAQIEQDSSSQWLLKTYPQIFQLPSFYEQLSQFFNYFPPSSFASSLP